jgi:hypothetical protein
MLVGKGYQKMELRMLQEEPKFNRNASAEASVARIFEM